MSKTEGIWLHTEAIPNNLINIKWSFGPVKSLGVYFGINRKQVHNLNWESKLDKLKRLLSVWRKRDLTVYGKAVVVKVIALSQMYYNISVIETPDFVVKEIETVIYDFLWKGKRDKIKRACIINDHVNGGIKFPDIKSKLNSLSASWVRRNCNSEFARWKLIPISYLEYFGRNLLIFKMNFSKDVLFPFFDDNMLPKFYEQIVKNWHRSNVLSSPPATLNDIKAKLYGEIVLYYAIIPHCFQRDGLIVI
jgi:hypothetical protein